MIILEFSMGVWMQGRVPSQLCLIHKPMEQNPKHRRYFDLADRVYSLHDNQARVMKDRNGVPADFEISGEDAVALILKAAVL